MTEFRPRIFIGSSSEAKHIAQMVLSECSTFADCKIWTEQFEIGNSAYEDLVSKLGLYDYGILVASADDKITSRDKPSTAPRDNIIFEFGMFAGRLGRSRSFLLTESGIKVPSDLNGITLPFFPRVKKSKDPAEMRSEAKKLKAAIRQSCQKIRAHIKKRDNIIDYGFLPSTSLAYGYYNNFVLKVVSTLLDSGKLNLGNTCEFPNGCQKEKGGQSAANDPLQGMRITDLCLTVCLPKRLSANMFDHVKQLRISENWRLIKIDAGSFRPFDFHVQAHKSSAGTLQLLDMPLTLNALDDSIRAYVGKSHMGFSEAEKLLEIRELRTFKRVLSFLIHENPLTRGRVKIEIVN
jgi:hypothetical protein